MSGLVPKSLIGNEEHITSILISRLLVCLSMCIVEITGLEPVFSQLRSLYTILLYYIPICSFCNTLRTTNCANLRFRGKSVHNSNEQRHYLSSILTSALTEVLFIVICRIYLLDSINLIMQKTL